MDFQWSDHTPVIFTYWHPFEPNNFHNTPEDCVSMWGVVSEDPQGAGLGGWWGTFMTPLVCSEQLCPLFLPVCRGFAGGPLG